jgi:hypothetical protein
MFTKSRGIYGADVEPFEIRMTDGEWTCLDTTDLLEAQVAARLAEGKNLRHIASVLGINKNEADRLKKKLGK